VTSAPVLLFKVEPEYSDEARRAKITGSVVLEVEVDENGRPRNIRVVQSLGLGLDEQAAAAVARWRFRPAMRAGRPAAHPAVIEVNFHLL
jgi:TonB family protein